MKVLLDSAFTPGFSETAALVVALAWLAGIAAAAVLVFRLVAQLREA